MKSFSEFHNNKILTEGAVADIVSAIRNNLRMLSDGSQAFFDMVSNDKEVKAVLDSAGKELTSKELRKLQNILVKKFSVKEKDKIDMLMQDLHYATRHAT